MPSLPLNTLSFFAYALLLALSGPAQSSDVELPANARALLARYADPDQNAFDAPAFAEAGEVMRLAGLRDEREDCGVGAIVRTFERIDAGGAVVGTYVQRVSAAPGHAYSVFFPNDRDVVHASQALPVSGRFVDADGQDIHTLTHANDKLDVTVTERRLGPNEDASDDACATVIRVYDVINWCEWDGASEGILVTNPAGTSAGPRLDVSVDAQGAVAVQLDFVPVSLTSVGRWRYEQKIRTFDDRAPLVIPGMPRPREAQPIGVSNRTLASEDTARSLQIPFQVRDATGSDLDVSYYLVLNTGSRQPPADELPGGESFRQRAADPYGALEQRGDGRYAVVGRYPAGDHAVVIRAINACGNLTERTVGFSVNATRTLQTAPQIGAVITLDQSGSYRLRADQLRAASPENRGRNAFSFSLNPADSVLALDCSDVGSVALRVFMTDEAGHRDFEERYVLVRGSKEGCGALSLVGGDDGFTFDAPRPNPVTNVAELHFSLPTAGEVKLAVTDMAGHRRFGMRETFEAGRATLTIPALERLGVGTFECTLRFGEEILTRTLVVVE